MLTINKSFVQGLLLYQGYNNNKDEFSFSHFEYNEHGLVIEKLYNVTYIIDPINTIDNKCSSNNQTHRIVITSQNQKYHDQKYYNFANQNIYQKISDNKDLLIFKHTNNKVHDYDILVNNTDPSFPMMWLAFDHTTDFNTVISSQCRYDGTIFKNCNQELIKHYISHFHHTITGGDTLIRKYSALVSQDDALLNDFVPPNVDIPSMVPKHEGVNLPSPIWNLYFKLYHSDLNGAGHKEHIPDNSRYTPPSSSYDMIFSESIYDIGVLFQDIQNNNISYDYRFHFYRPQHVHNRDNITYNIKLLALTLNFKPQFTSNIMFEITREESSNYTSNTNTDELYTSNFKYEGTLFYCDGRIIDDYKQFSSSMSIYYPYVCIKTNKMLLKLPIQYEHNVSKDLLKSGNVPNILPILSNANIDDFINFALNQICSEGMSNSTLQKKWGKIFQSNRFLYSDRLSSILDDGNALDLSTRCMGDEQITILADLELQDLTYLDLSHNYISPNGVSYLMDIVNIMPNLRALDISYNHIGYGIQYFNIIPNNPSNKINYLDVSNNHILEITFIQFVHNLHNNNQLLYLHLGDIVSTAEGAESILSMIKDNFTLSQLVVSNAVNATNTLNDNNYIGTIEFYTRQNAHVHKITQLVDTTKVIDDTIKSDIAKNLKGLGNNTLNITNYPLSESNINAIEDPDSKIKNLILKNASITDEHVKIIVIPLDHNNQLESLDLSHNYIRDDGAMYIANPLVNNTHLQSLNLANNNISDSGIWDIVGVVDQNTNLKQVDLSGNPIQENGVELLSSALENNFVLLQLLVAPSS